MDQLPLLPSGAAAVAPSSIRFVHTADWQLGMARHFLDAEAQARFDQSRIDAVARIGELAVAQGAAFVVVCGDVFDANHVARKVVVRALEAMGAADVPFFLLPGNHDALDAAAVLRSRTFAEHRPPNVHVLDGSGPVLIAPGVELVGAPWTSKRPLVDLCQAAYEDLPADGTLRILAGHGAADALSPDPTDPALIVLARAEAALAAGQIHYLALGDRHSTTSVGSSGRAWYSGAPEPTAYDEVDPGHVLVVDVSADDVAVARHAVGTWRFVRRDAALDSIQDVEDLSTWLGGLASKDRTIVKLSLVGALSLAAAARLEEVLDHHADLFAAIESWERHRDLVVVPDVVDVESLGVGGFVRDAVTDLQAVASGGGPDAAVAGDALTLLYRLARVAS